MQQTIGRYEIRQELGRGGMATVYLAFDPRVERLVAIKILPPDLGGNPDFRERFHREARVIARLEHPAILPIYDFGDENNQLYFVMPYMSGGTLSERLSDGPLPIEVAIKLLERIGGALGYAHQQGIVHRDLKPANIIFDQFGNGFLADFGIARFEELGNTLTGVNIVGTPSYMSPEQAQAGSNVDEKADIYALGVILFELLTGKRPYVAETAMGIALKHISDPIPLVHESRPDLPQAFDDVVGKAMSKEPESRYASVGDLTTAVKAVANGEPLPAHLHPDLPKGKSKRSSAQSSGGGGRFVRWLLLIVGIFILMGAVIGVLAVSGVFSALLAPEPTETPTTAATVAPTETSEPTDTPQATATDTPVPPTATSTATKNPTATNSPTASATATELPPSPTLASTPTPTNTPIPPTSTPVPPTNTPVPPTQPPPTNPPPPPPTNPPPPPPTATPIPP